MFRILCMKLFFFSPLLWAALFSADIEGTLLLAQKEKKPLIIDFYGIWCPPCNELDETVFESSGFTQRAKAFRLLKVDADKPGSWAIKDRYKVGGYPTVVFTDPQGKEIYRIVGYRTPNEFFRIMDLVSSSKASPLERACRSKDPESLWRCAVVCAERKDKKCADKAYRELERTLKPGSPRYEAARAHFVDNAPNEDLKRNGYEKLILEFPSSPNAPLWAMSYLELFEDNSALKPKKELIEKILSQYEKILTDPRAEEMGVTRTDLLQYRATLLEKTGNQPAAKKAWAEAADALAALAATLPPGSAARGFTLERIYCLERSGDIEGALALAKAYSLKFPEEFTFHYSTASLLERAKRYQDAFKPAQSAYAASYGDNKIRSATLLIRLYATVPDKASAKKVLEEVTSEIKPDHRLDVRTHRYLRQLNEAYLKNFASAS